MLGCVPRIRLVIANPMKMGPTEIVLAVWRDGIVLVGVRELLKVCDV